MLGLVAISALKSGNQKFPKIETRYGKIKKASITEAFKI